MRFPRPLHQTFALDRSLRRIDVDGHMHVEMANISKANVCPYYGREIPDNEALGLDAGKIYWLYRDPVELKKGAASFAGKPILLHHVPVNADEPSKELQVGCIGTTVTFDGTYLRAPLSLWTRDGIDAVESGEQEQLSPGYRYRADMTRGRTPEGVAYDGVMRDIMGNHLALVSEGRTGPDVVVPDSLPSELSKMKFPKLLAALAGLFPEPPKAEYMVALDAALDADLSDKAVMDALNDEERTTACDGYAKELNKALDALTDEEKSHAYKRAAADKLNGKSASKSPAASSGNTPPHAADAAATQVAVDAAVAEAVKDKVTKAAADQLAADAATAARAEVHALYNARKAVEAVVGDVALETAEAVYRFALDHLKVDHKETAVAGLPALFDASAQTAARAPVQPDTGIAFDRSILGISHIRKG